MSTLLSWSVSPRGLHPPFHLALDDVFAKALCEWVVVEATVNRERQVKKWEAFRRSNGPRTGAPDQDPHQFGCAVNVAPCTETGATYDIRLPAWRWLVEQFPLESPLRHGREIGFDWTHIEWRAWRSVAEAACSPS